MWLYWPGFEKNPPIGMNVMDLNFNCDLFITVQRTCRWPRLWSACSLFLLLCFDQQLILWNSWTVSMCAGMYVCSRLYTKWKWKSWILWLCATPLGNWLMRKSHFIDIFVASGFHINTIERNELLLLHRNGTQSPELYLYCPFPLCVVFSTHPRRLLVLGLSVSARKLF